MITKWLLMAGVIYLIYRFYKGMPFLTEGRSNEEALDRSGPEEDKGEFIDYEEVD